MVSAYSSSTFNFDDREQTVLLLFWDILYIGNKLDRILF